MLYGLFSMGVFAFVGLSFANFRIKSEFGKEWL
jgi:hypothetical protein